MRMPALARVQRRLDQVLELLAIADDELAFDLHDRYPALAPCVWLKPIALAPVSCLVALQRHHGGHLDNIIGRGPARQVGHRAGQALKHRADGRGPGQPLHQLVARCCRRRGRETPARWRVPPPATPAPSAPPPRGSSAASTCTSPSATMLGARSRNRAAASRTRVTRGPSALPRVL